ncbi:MAG TPA: site-2 protease family protein, partial [Bacteroidia bacterium]|nr:site-2 protease family protein [Bacteroidia bacterium]
MDKLRWSLSLGKIKGIAIYIHWTFLILIIWAFFSAFSATGEWKAGVNSILFILSLFVCVVLHELGHALVAGKYGFPAKSITLLPIGGVASLERIPEKPSQELWMALAGPLVNVVIAGI